MTIEFKAIEFETAHQAIQWSEADGGRAILVDGRNFVVHQAEADRLAAAGVEMAWLHDQVMPDLPVRARTQTGGEHRIITVPIN